MNNFIDGIAIGKVKNLFSNIYISIAMDAATSGKVYTHEIFIDTKNYVE